MRHLIDSYIDAEESETISAFDDMTIVDLINLKGVDAVEDLPKGIKKKDKAVAEAIENNVRKLIIEQKPTNPRFYEKMSVLLNELIKERKQSAISYANYLKKIVELVRSAKNAGATNYPESIDTNALRSLYDNLENKKDRAIYIHKNILKSKQDDWKGNKIKEKQVKYSIRKALAKFDISEESEVERIFKLAVNQDEY